jgi:transcriptional regulator with XRE-family HTH domain
MPGTTAQLAKKIRTARLRSGLPQTEFARKLRISQQKLSDWERGKRLRALVTALSVAKILKLH